MSEFPHTTPEEPTIEVGLEETMPSTPELVSEIPILDIGRPYEYDNPPKPRVRGW